jgi:hypothetical protein
MTPSWIDSGAEAMRTRAQVQRARIKAEKDVRRGYLRSDTEIVKFA